ncbi:MAG: hypothetical protein ACRD6U_05050 [Nitrososphaeraceae archaeon]
MSKHSTSAVTKPFPLFIPNTVIFHPVKSANGSLDISNGIAGSKPGWGVPIWPTSKLPLNAVSPRSQFATELAKLRVKTSSLVSPTFL